MDLLQLFKTILETTKGGASKNTIKNYLSDVRHFISWFESLTGTTFQIEKISSDIVRLYSESRGGQILHGDIQMGTQLSSVSTKRHLSSLRKFFAEMEKAHVASRNPFAEITPAVDTTPTDYWHLSTFKDYLLGERVSKLTVKNYLSDINGFAKWYEEAILPGLSQPLTKNQGFYLITQSVLENYRARLIEIQNAAPRTINRKLSSLRKYLDFATKKGFIENSELYLSPVQLSQGIQAVEEPKFNLSEIKEVTEVKEASYSKFPPLRLLQKLIIFPYLALEEKSASTIASLLIGTSIAGLSSLPQKVNSELIQKSALRNQVGSVADLLRVRNVAKEFYAPEKINLNALPIHKQIFHHAKHSRPSWYKKYHNYTFVHYVHFALLIIFASGVGVALFQNLVAKKQAPTYAAATAPPRILSFQGRLTDNLDNPITTERQVRFSIYNTLASTGSAQLWEEVRTVSPDQDGIFSVLLGSDVNGANAATCGAFPLGSPSTGPCLIPSTVFSDNSQIWLGVTIGATAELAPRQKIATVGYATNSEFLQGLPPSTQAGITSFANVVLALDSSGNLTLSDSAPTNHTFQVTNGQFRLSGQSLYLTSNTGSNGDVILSPDGFGRIDIQRPIINSTTMGNVLPGGVEINDRFAILATESAVAAFIVNNNTTGGDIFAASSSGTTRFRIANNGSIVSSLYTGQNGVLFGTMTTGVLDQATTSTPSLCLQSTSTNPVWGTCGTSGFTSPFREFTGNGGGFTAPLNSTWDNLFGGQATNSAAFRVVGQGNPFRGTLPAASVSANTSWAAFVVDNKGTGDLFAASQAGQTKFKIASNGDIFVGPNGTGKITAAIIDPYLVQNQYTTGNTQLTFQTMAASNGDFIFQNQSTELARILQAGQLQLPITGSGAGLVLGGDAQIFRGAADRIDVASGDSINLVSGSLLTAGTTRIDASGNGTFANIVVTGTCTGCISTGNSPFQVNNGAIVAGNTTLDFLLGSQATASAKFAVLGLNSGTPTASVSSGLSGTGAYFDANGFFQTAKDMTLTLGGDTTGNIAFRPGNSPTSLQLNSNGNVGIGTALPGTKLQVTQPNQVLSGLIGTSHLSLQTSDNQGTDIGAAMGLGGYIDSGSTARNFAVIAGRKSNNSSGDSSGYLSLSTHQSGVGLVERMRIDHTGNVGINTSAPTALLDVNGTASVAGVFKLSGATPRIQSTANQTLIIGGDTTGNIILSPNGGAGNVRFSNLNTSGGLVYVNAGGILAQTGAGSTSQCLLGGDTPSFGSCVGSSDASKWDITNGAISPKQASTLDFLLGAQATNSAKFAVLNIGNGQTPTASISANSSNNATYLSGNGTLATTNKQTLNLGSSSTGLINIINGAGSTFTTFDTVNSRIGVGTSTPFAPLHIAPTGQSVYAMFQRSDNALYNVGQYYMPSGAASGSNVQWITGILAGSNNFSIWNWNGSQNTTALSITNSNALGVGTTAPDAALEINHATGDNLRLTYNDADGSASNYTDFTLASDGDLTIDSAGGLITTPDALTIGGTLTANGTIALGDGDDIAINSNDWDISSAGVASGFTGLTSSGTITFSGFTGANNGGVVFANSAGVLSQTGAGSTGQCLLGGTTPSFGSCVGSTDASKWDIISGAITPKQSSTLDFLLGAQSTSSAKFAVLNIGSGQTPSASVSAQNIAGQALSMSGDGSLQTTRNNTLTVGGNTTGDIQFKPGNASSSLILGSNGNAAIGTDVASNITLNLQSNSTGELLRLKSTEFGDWDGTSFMTFYNNLNEQVGIIGDTQDYQDAFVINAVANDKLYLGGNNINVMEITGNKVGIGTINTNSSPAGTNSQAAFHVTRPNMFGATGKSLVIFDQTENQDIFAASASGITKFVIKNDGTASSSAGFTINGIGSVQSTNNQTLTLGGGSTGNLIIGRTSQSIFLPGFDCNALTNGGKLTTTSGGALTCSADTGGTAGFSSPFRESSSPTGTIFALNSTLDFLAGGQSSSSAAFRVTGQGNPFAGTLAAASVSAKTSFAGLVVDNTIGDIFAASSSGLARFVIKNDGKVGIGTTTPTELLALAGGNFTITAPRLVEKGTIKDGVGATQMDFASSVQVVGKYAYVASAFDDALSIVDITNPSSPVELGNIKDGGGATELNEANDVYVAGKYAYVTSGDNALSIIDASNPSSPVEVGTIKDDEGATELTGANDVYVAGKYAYVTSTTDAALSIFDVSNPSSPVEVGTIKDGVGATELSGASEVFVAGKYAYVASFTDDSLSIIDVSNPASPTEVSVIKDGAGATQLDGANSVYISGRYAYVASRFDMSLSIIDISNPASPTEIGTIKDGVGATQLDAAFSVVVAGKYAYVASSTDDSITIIDVSNPASPTEVSVIKDGVGATQLDGANSIFLAGKYVYTTSGNDDSLSIIDVSGIDVPTAQIGSLASNNINVSENLIIGNSVTAGNSLNIGSGGLFSSGAFSIASIGGSGNIIQGSPIGGALLVLNQLSLGQDIFAASSAGVTKFVIKNDGTASSSAGFTINGLGSLQSTNNQMLSLGGNSTGDIYFKPGNNLSSLFLGSNGAVGLGTFNSPTGLLPAAKLHVFSTLGTSPVASFSGRTTEPTLLVTNEGSGDLFVASAAGKNVLRLYYDTANDRAVITNTLPGSKFTNFDTFDPLYTIGNKNYSTFGVAMVGLKEEVQSSTTLSFDPTIGKYKKTIDFNNLEFESDLWIFAHAVTPDLNLLDVLLTPNTQSKVWFEKDPVNRKITLLSDRPTDVTYRFTAPRYDYSKYPLVNTEPEAKGHIRPVDLPTMGLGVADGEDDYLNGIVLAIRNGQHVIVDEYNNSISRIEAFSKATIANLTAGIINAQRIAVGSFEATTSSLGNATANTFAVAANGMTVGGQNLRDYIIATIQNANLPFYNPEVISPLAKYEHVKTNVISPLADDSEISLELSKSEIAIRNASQKVAWFDNKGNATFNGTLAANNIQTNNASVAGTLAAGNIQTNDASVSGTLRTNNLIARNIEGLDNRIASIASNLIATNTQPQPSTPSSYPSGGNIAVNTIQANFGIFEHGITSMAPVTATNVTATDSIAIGNAFTITGNAINTIGPDLEIQSLRQGAIAFQGGQIRMDTDGNLSVNGNFNILGMINAVSGIFTDTLKARALATDLISPLADDSEISIDLKNSQLTIRNSQQATSSAVLTIDNKGNINSSGSATVAKLNFNLVGEAHASSLTEATASGSAGFATLRSGQPEITINNPNVTEKSLIYITPFGNTNGRVLYLLRQVPQSEITGGSFTVGASGPSTQQDLQFNWLIVN